jgi:hypothetical protein
VLCQYPLCWFKRSYYTCLLRISWRRCLIAGYKTHDLLLCMSEGCTGDVFVSCWVWHRTANVQQIGHYDDRLHFEIIITLDCIICSVLYQHDLIYCAVRLFWISILIYQLNVWWPWIMIFSCNILLDRTLMAAAKLRCVFVL